MNQPPASQYAKADRDSDQPVVGTRPATPGDVPALAALMISYMRETYDDDWHGSPEALLRDGFGEEFEMLVAAQSGSLVGLAAWRQTYDLHHCITGAEVIDMFVIPAVRGRSIGPLLICAVAAEIVRRGGKYLKGQAVADLGVRRLYERVAVSFVATDCTIGGRALRAVAKLECASSREIARSLPPKSWNYEP